MQISSISLQDFINVERGVAEFHIVYATFGSHKISEIILPLSSNNPSDSEELILEMPLTLWQQAKKRPFSQLLPWSTTVPPAWTGHRIQCESSNSRHPIYVPLHIIPGHFKHGRFTIASNPEAALEIITDESGAKPYQADLLIRQQYGEALRYRGTTPEQAKAAGGLFFQAVPNLSDPHHGGVEYWILSNR